MSGVHSGRKPGRPIGTGAYQATDLLLLQQVADLKLAKTTMTTTALIKQVVTSNDTGGIRRLQRKFKADAPALMVEAQARRRVRMEAQFVAMYTAAVEFIHGVQRKAETFSRSPDGQQLIEGVRHFNQVLRHAVIAPQLQPWLRLVSTLQSEPTAQKIT